MKFRGTREAKLTEWKSKSFEIGPIRRGIRRGCVPLCSSVNWCEPSWRVRKVNPLFQDCFLFLFFFFSTLLCVSFLDLCFRNFLPTRFNTINDLNPRLTSSHIRRRQGLLLHLESFRVLERYFSKGGIKIRRKKRIDKGREGLRKRRTREERHL